MSTEYIKGIGIAKDGGVYLVSRSSNDDRYYREWRCNGLSDVYAAEGQKGLDREIVRMLSEYASLVGMSKSIQRYRYALEAPETNAIHQKYHAQINDRYECLSEYDKKHLYGTPSTAAQEYRAFEQNMRTKMYAEIAEQCQAYDAKQPKRDMERYGNWYRTYDMESANDARKPSEAGKVVSPFSATVGHYRMGAKCDFSCNCFLPFFCFRSCVCCRKYDGCWNAALCKTAE